ncbi:MAG: CPBP family intramembrane metalloprotease [Deltaproteobacteria bacterium]|nr:CPBP family intramembrane metalloprotease [Deltaproteobacteria bacterium]
MEAEKIGIKLFTISLFLLLLSETGSVFLSSVFSNHNMLILGSTRVLQLAVFLFAVSIFGQSMSDIGLGRQQIVPGIIIGLKWSFWFGVVALALLTLIFFIGFDILKILHTRLPATGGNLLLFFLVGGVIAPVTEEVLFRGILYGFFRRWGILIALFMSTLFFVLAHQAFSLIQITGGIIFAVSYEKEGKLMVPIMIHSLGNLSLFTLSIYAENTIIPILCMYF